MTKYLFEPPTLDEVQKYIADNPKLANIDAEVFWHGYNDGGWIATNGEPVRNWKLKLWTWRNFDAKRVTKKTKLFPISGKTCSKQGCPLPAVYKNTGGNYDSYACAEHMPEKVKEKYVG